MIRLSWSKNTFFYTYKKTSKNIFINHEFFFLRYNTSLYKLDTKSEY